MADMGVSIDQAGGDIKTAGINNLSFFPARMLPVRAYIADPIVQNGYFLARKDLSGINVDELPVDDEEVCFLLPHGPTNEPADLFLGPTYHGLFRIWNLTQSPR